MFIQLEIDNWKQSKETLVILKSEKFVNVDNLVDKASVSRVALFITLEPNSNDVKLWYMSMTFRWMEHNAIY